MNRRWGLLLAGIACSTGCVIEHAGPTQHDFQSIDRDNVELVRVNLNMGAGELRVDSGTDKLATADFTYNVPRWKPEVRYTNTAGRGNLTISQPERGASVGNSKYEWDLRLNKDVPMDITAHFGAGEGRMNLSDLTLRGVEIEMGVGELNLDLRGSPKKSYEVRIRGGVGEATVRLPSRVGVEADVKGGIGEVTASGLHQDGKRYYNDALADSKVAIHLDVEGGVGSIHLISE